MSSQREDRKNKWWFAIHPKQKERASVIVLLVSAATAHAAFFYIHTSSHSIYIHSQQSVVVVVVVVDRGARRWRKKKTEGGIRQEAGWARDGGQGCVADEGGGECARWWGGAHQWHDIKTEKSWCDKINAQKKQSGILFVISSLPQYPPPPLWPCHCASTWKNNRTEYSSCERQDRRAGIGSQYHLVGRHRSNKPRPRRNREQFLAQEHVNLSPTHLDGHSCCGSVESGMRGRYETAPSPSPPAPQCQVVDLLCVCWFSYRNRYKPVQGSQHVVTNMQPVANTRKQPPQNPATQSLK